jgi:hypothetical protein
MLKVYGITLGVVSLYLFLFMFFPIETYRLSILALFLVLLAIGFGITVKISKLIIPSHYYIICVYLFLCFSMATSGGVEAPGSIWLLLCPLVSFLTLSAPITRFWIIVVISTVVAFYLFEEFLVVDSFKGGKLLNMIAPSLLFATVYNIN